ncbi:hypothetical protein KCU81_g26, partial [Aureobasidium melanogenum]
LVNLTFTRQTEESAASDARASPVCKAHGSVDLRFDGKIKATIKVNDGKCGERRLGRDQGGIGSSRSDFLVEERNAEGGATERFEDGQRGYGLRLRMTLPWKPTSEPLRKAGKDTWKARREVPGATLSAAAAEATVGLVDDGVAAICTSRRGGERRAWLGRVQRSSCCARQRIAVDIARLAMVQECQDAAANPIQQRVPTRSRFVRRRSVCLHLLRLAHRSPLLLRTLNSSASSFLLTRSWPSWCFKPSNITTIRNPSRHVGRLCPSRHLFLP